MWTITTNLAVQLAAVCIPLALQTIYFAYRFGRIEARLDDHEHRIRRLESIQDHLLVQATK